MVAWARHVPRQADTNSDGSISKRELYRAFERLGLNMTPSEELSFWKTIDRDQNNRVDWREFRRAGLALHSLGELRLASPSAAAPAGAGHATVFAQRTYSDEARVHSAATRLSILARRGSEELIRGARSVLVAGGVAVSSALSALAALELWAAGEVGEGSARSVRSWLSNGWSAAIASRASRVPSVAESTRT